MNDQVARTGVEHDCPLTARSVRRWADAAARLVGLAQPVINGANVFPVADSDTGTNLLLTLRQGADQLALLPDDTTWEDGLQAFARGALIGARGNSGIILSEYLRGFALGARRPPGHTAADDARVVAAALQSAASCAYAAVGHPRPGTILTAARGAADGAAGGGDSVVGVTSAARSGAYAAFLRSVDELDVLTAAGVLDAGAYGLVLVLDSLGAALARPVGLPGAGNMSQVDGMIAIMSSLAVDRPRRGPAPDPAERRAAIAAPDGHTDVDGEFEVMCVVEHTGTVAEVGGVGLALRRALGELGESVVVVGGAETGTDSAPGGAADAGGVSGIWQVHVHTDNVLDALRVVAGWTYRQVVVRCLPRQVATRAAGEPAEHGLVACTTAPGLVPDLARTGAVVVLEGSVPIASADVLRAAIETDARAVSVLPASRLTLELLDRELGDPVSGAPALTVLPSTSDLHVVAAMAAWVGTDLAELHGIDQVLRGAVNAVRTVTLEGDDRHGPFPALAGLIDFLVPGPDARVTVLVDDACPADTLSAVLAQVAARAPEIDTVVLSSGRRSANLLVGIEQA